MDKDENPAEPIEPQNKYAREAAAFEDRQQAMTEKKTSILDEIDSEAMTEKKITGEKVRVEGPSPTYEGDKKFCPLCKRFVSPTGLNVGAVVVLGTTAIAGIMITWLHNWSVSTGTYDYYTGTATLTLTEAYLSALLSFALDIFIVLLIASFAYGVHIMGQEKRCPVCNAHLS